MYLKTQKFLILGVSKSGSAVANYLLENGAQCYLYEDLKASKIQACIEALCKKGAKWVEKEQVDGVLKDIDVLVISPGVAINHPVAVKAKEQNVRIIGELEFGFNQFNPVIVAVTGTNGKTTTVSLINAILKENQTQSLLVGNIGKPITGEIKKINKNTVCVTEVSSFQLESTHSFCPHISCILNIAPDHLERHYSMENYIFLKKKIFKCQTASEYTVLNFDDNTVKEFSAECKAKTLFVSLKEQVDGAYVSNGKIYYFEEYILDVNELSLNGEHNVYDSLFAICVSKLLGVPNRAICRALKNFKGVRHRMELVAEKNGVKYFNDSKATNTASTISAIDTMKAPTVIILGGSEKGENYELLFDKIKKSQIKHTVITGASRFNMIRSAEKVGYTHFTVTQDFSFAVKIASMLANDGENVLLSPACASFDCFGNFEERGDVFINEVKKVCEQ